MGGKTFKGQRQRRRKILDAIHPIPAKPSQPDPSKLDKLPVSYQQINDYYEGFQEAQPFNLRKETFVRIEAITGRPLICYVAKTSHVAPILPIAIDDSDLIGFTDLAHSVAGKEVDVLIESNGGSPEAAERIVRFLRERFDSIRFIVPGNAYSAATLICFSGDKPVMSQTGTLGPIDPQINGIPARAIRRAFENLEERLAKEGPKALTAYVPLISKYDLHLLEICKSAENLSKELAECWLSEYMLRCAKDDPRVKTIVDHFSDYDEHKSHGRSIGRMKTRELQLEVEDIEDTPGLADLIRSLHNQYGFWFDKTAFIKMFEDARGIGADKRRTSQSSCHLHLKRLQHCHLSRDHQHVQARGEDIITVRLNASANRESPGFTTGAFRFKRIVSCRFQKSIAIAVISISLAFDCCESPKEKTVPKRPNAKQDTGGTKLSSASEHLLAEVGRLYVKPVSIVLRDDLGEAIQGASDTNQDGTPVVYVARGIGQNETNIVHELFHLKMQAEGYPLFTITQLPAVEGLSKKEIDSFREWIYDPLTHAICYPQIRKMGLDPDRNTRLQFQRNLVLVEQPNWVAPSKEYVATYLMKVSLESSDPTLRAKLEEWYKTKGWNWALDRGRKLLEVAGNLTDDPEALPRKVVECLNFLFDGRANVSITGYDRRQLGSTTKIYVLLKVTPHSQAP